MKEPSSEDQQFIEGDTVSLQGEVWSITPIKDGSTLIEIKLPDGTQYFAKPANLTLVSRSPGA